MSEVVVRFWYAPLPREKLLGDGVCSYYVSDCPLRMNSEAELRASHPGIAAETSSLQELHFINQVAFRRVDKMRIESFAVSHFDEGVRPKLSNIHSIHPLRGQHPWCEMSVRELRGWLLKKYYAVVSQRARAR